MPSFTCCVSCDVQKRGKDDKFYLAGSIANPLTCINYVRRTHVSQKRKVQVDALTALQPDSKLCKVCYKLCSGANDSGVDLDIEEDFEAADLSIYRQGGNSHHRCTFGCSSSHLISVPKLIQRELLMEYKMWVKDDARMCSAHVDIQNYWPLVRRVSREISTEDQKAVMDLMYTYYHEHKNENKWRFDLENLDGMNDCEFKSWFAYNKEQFKEICSLLKLCEAKHVAALLCKMRTALSNEQIGYLFGVSRFTISNYLRLASGDFLTNLVPKFINHNGRSVLLTHNTPMSRTLFDIPYDKVGFIFDATYRLAQKSANFAGQKQLWSEQKKAPLVKPMVGCLPDGFVSYVLGPFDAKHNDATILQDCFDRYPEILGTIHHGDTVLVDRGFRDVLDFLRDEKLLNVFCPGLGQLETQDANASRFVTKCRWVIEQVFGRLKTKFKLFSVAAQNSTLKYDFDLVSIGFALLNMFHKPIFSDKEHQDIAVIMKSRLQVPNLLKEVVQKYNLSQVKTPYIDVEYTLLDDSINNELLGFPELSLEDLYKVSLGPYQINNAASYYAEHQKEGIFLVHKFDPPRRHPTATLDYAKYAIAVTDPLLIKAYMRSRYRNGKHHHIFVLLDKSKTGRDSIREYYCTCESGSRTVGCCSHIMAIIWFLGYAQYKRIQTPNPGICDVSITIAK